MPSELHLQQRTTSVKSKLLYKQLQDSLLHQRVKKSDSLLLLLKLHPTIQDKGHKLIKRELFPLHGLFRMVYFYDTYILHMR